MKRHKNFINICPNFCAKSSRHWRNTGQRNRPKSVKFKLKFGISWLAHALHAGSHDHCPSDRNVQDWDNFTPYPTMPLVYIGIVRGVPYNSKARKILKHIKGKPKSRFNPNHNSQGRHTISQDNRTTMTPNLKEPLSPVEFGTTNPNKDNKKIAPENRLCAKRPSQKSLLTQ